MGTGGFIGFVADGQTKVAYNHWDAYPSGVGLTTLRWLRGVDHATAAEAARGLRVVAADDSPTPEDVERLKRFYDPSVGDLGGGPTWYQLLRGTQGDPAAILFAGVVEDARKFPADSLFAEWGFVVDFDKGVFEAHEGFQVEPHTEGRFASMTPRENGYYPVKLRASWPLTALPSEDAFLAELGDE